MKSLENVSNNHRKEDLKLLFYGILVGIAAGGLSSFYRYIIHGIEGIIGGIVNIFTFIRLFLLHLYLFLF